MSTLQSLLRLTYAPFAGHPGLTAFAVVFVLGAVVFIATREHPASHREADALDDDTVADLTRGLRIAAEDRERADWGWGTAAPTSRAHGGGSVGGGNVVAMVTAQAAGTPMAQVLGGLDERTAELVIDPTLKPTEVAEMLTHVAMGPGSVASVAAEVPDTKLRDAAEQAAVAVAEVEAYIEAEQQDARLLVASALEASTTMWADLDRKLWAIAPWIFYAHEDADAHCPHCATALSAVSGEYRKLTEHTQEIDRHALNALLAA
jgi:hypothetical protein